MKNSNLAETKSNYLIEPQRINDLFSDELDGLTPKFSKIKIPAGGALTFEIPTDNPNNPESVKSFDAVIIFKHPINIYYEAQYTGEKTPPVCSSINGKDGVVTETGETKKCKTCEHFAFGSGDNKKSKACKQKQRIFLLRPNEILPTIFTLPTGSLTEFSTYITRLLTTGKKSNAVVTTFALKKATNSTGIMYSQCTFAVKRDLTEAEYNKMLPLSETIRNYAKNVDIDDDEEDTPPTRTQTFDDFKDAIPLSEYEKEQKVKKQKELENNQIKLEDMGL